MRAAICYDFGEPLRVEEVMLDPPQHGEVKIRVQATAICHSDVHYIRGEWDIQRPFIAGHETAGLVEEVGEGVTMARPRRSSGGLIVTLLWSV